MRGALGECCCTAASTASQANTKFYHGPECDRHFASGWVTGSPPSFGPTEPCGSGAAISDVAHTNEVYGGMAVMLRLKGPSVEIPLLIILIAGGG